MKLAFIISLTLSSWSSLGLLSNDHQFEPPQPLDVYLARARGISQGTHKLTWTPIIIMKNKKEKENSPASFGS